MKLLVFLLLWRLSSWFYSTLSHLSVFLQSFYAFFLHSLFLRSLNKQQMASMSTSGRTAYSNPRLHPIPSAKNVCEICNTLTHSVSSCLNVLSSLNFVWSFTNQLQINQTMEIHCKISGLNLLNLNIFFMLIKYSECPRKCVQWSHVWFCFTFHYKKWKK